MSVRLEGWGTEAYRALPSGEDVEHVFVAEGLPRAPAVLLAGFAITRATHDYGQFRLDYPQLFAEPELLGRLGLLILSAAFHDGPDVVTVQLDHPGTEVRELVLSFDHPATMAGGTGLKVKPASLSYWVSQPGTHPFPDRTRPEDLPWFELTNSEDFAHTDAQRAARDVLRGPGTLTGAVRFATLLLDLSRPHCTTREVALESEAGFRGVAPASAELRLWLPGSLGWR